MKPASIDLKAESIRAALAAIAERNNGYLNPVAVVEAAKDPKSILHGEFEWDDDDAAHAYRVAQAGALIRRVKFTVMKTKKDDPTIVEIKTARTYESRPSARNKDQGYEQVSDIMKDEDKREELIQQVLKELSAYRKRYASLMALSDVWYAIDMAMDELAPGQGKAAQAGHGVESRVV
jgi:hypothetical protein